MCGRTLAVCVVAASLSLTSAVAAEYPSKPIRLVVPAPAGGLQIAMRGSSPSASAKPCTSLWS